METYYPVRERGAMPMPIRFRAYSAVLLFAAFFYALSLVGPAWAQSDAVSGSAQNLGQWERALQSDLIAEKFDGLDSVAGHLRAERTRLAGGDWQLHVFYAALDAPQQSEQDSLEHITHLEHWMAQRPDSVTARVALATALTRWAWVARGHGYASTVTAEGRKLFMERMKEAQAVLESSVKTCPQWYYAMMMVGNAQGWDAPRMHQLLADGIKFEPGYYYLYLQYANYLLPKWHGNPGDASRFAQISADAIGGDGGDILYYQIATNLIKLGDDEFPPHEMDWQRIQRGYLALASQFGLAHRTENELAFMAWRLQDSEIAHRQFTLIGENWSRAVWRDRNYFDRARDWSHSPTTTPLPGQTVLRVAPTGQEN
jgi:hypothetical protein